MPASRRARKIRQADEFLLARLQHALIPPIRSSAAYSWTLEQIMLARDQQMAGRFRAPARLAASMRTDDALFVAYKNRLAPARALAVAIEPAPGPRGRSIASEAGASFGQDGLAISSDTIADINGDLANHGLAVGYNVWTPRDDGARVDILHQHWPLEFCQWLPIGVDGDPLGQLVTEINQSSWRISGYGGLVPIVHGDGRWTIYRSHATYPWQQDAAILPGALIWARHAFGARDWSRGSASHGNAKVVGELAAGVPLQKTDAEGVVSISDEAEAFLALLADLSSLDQPYGIKPSGAKVDYLINGSRAWEVWERLMTNAEKAAARIYLGTDGTLGATGGAPGVDIAALFGVATTIIQADLGAIERGFHGGVMEPWTAINFGDSSHAPRRRYQITDPDEQRVRDEMVKQREAFFADLERMRAGGFVVTQATVDAVAELYGVEAPELAVAPATVGTTDAGMSGAPANGGNGAAGVTRAVD